jgi:(p)ppGpp synthase/HD superfamily hydrolase
MTDHPYTDEAVIQAHEIELDGGDVMLQELSLGDPIEIERQTGPLGPGIWVITEFLTTDRSRARVRHLTREEIQAARSREAFARIYE